MSVHPLPPDESNRALKESVRRPFATFQCFECLHIFADRIPPIFEDLPNCPLCEATSVLYHILTNGGLPS